MIRSLNESLKMVGGFMQSNKRRAKAAKDKLREAEERLMKNDDKLRTAKEQNVIMKNNLVMVKTELQN